MNYRCIIVYFVWLRFIVYIYKKKLKAMKISGTKSVICQLKFAFWEAAPLSREISSFLPGFHGFPSPASRGPSPCTDPIATLIS